MLSSFEEERRCTTSGGKPSERLSEELGVLSPLGTPTGKPPRGPLRGSGFSFFSGSGLVLPLHRCTSVSLRELQFAIHNLSRKSGTLSLGLGGGDAPASGQACGPSVAKLVDNLAEL